MTIADARIVCIRLHRACKFSKLSRSSAVCMTSINDLMYSYWIDQRGASDQLVLLVTRKLHIMGRIT